MNELRQYMLHPVESIDRTGTKPRQGEREERREKENAHPP
jgi:hypothetical protein